MTYERALRDIDKANWERAYRLLQFVAVAFRPLRIAELAEILSFGFKTGAIPEFHEGWRLEDPVDAVLSITSCLLDIVNVQGSSAIQFYHFSVKEYLTSSRLAETNDIICRRYHISLTPAHALAAQACLGILLHLDKNMVSEDGLEKYPLAEYAAKHWVDHARFEGVSENVEDGMKRLFDPNRPHLAIWVSIYDPILPPWSQTKQTQISLQPRGSALHYAAFYGLHFVVKFLVVQHSQDVRSRGFYEELAPLHLASQQGYDDVARLLLEYGADATARTRHGSTPLHFALGGRHDGVVRLLLQYDMDTTAQDEDGWTTLHLASQHGYEDVARVLLRHGADADARDNDDCTPLHWASQQNHLEVVRVLVEHGADINARDHSNWTPLHAASQDGHVEVVRLLLGHGVNAQASDQGGWTSLQWPSYNGDLEIVRMLLEYGVDADTLDNNNWTPLHSASQLGHWEVAQVLLEHGADANSRDYNNQTPLHLASRAGHTELVRLLIESGANIQVRINEGHIPFEEASVEKHHGGIQLLLS
jgi:ankyrin repeat protein